MPKLVLLRHGQSSWNKENRFTGWVDVGLSPAGVSEARKAGEVMRAAGIEFDLAYTSYLRRAAETLWLVLAAMDLCWLPVATDWRLNERHYGALTGRNKDEARVEFGPEQVQIWRRSYTTPPPPGTVAGIDIDRRYRGIQIPEGESLRDTLERVVPCWQERIVPDLRAGHTVLITAHGNSLRSLVKLLDNMDDEAIVEFEMPTGRPLVYSLDQDLRVQQREFCESG